MLFGCQCINTQFMCKHVYLLKRAAVSHSNRTTNDSRTFKSLITSNTLSPSPTQLSLHIHTSPLHLLTHHITITHSPPQLSHTHTHTSPHHLPTHHITITHSPPQLSHTHTHTSPHHLPTHHITITHSPPQLP